MKYMLLTNASQGDYDGMAGADGEHPAWTPQEFATMVEFMTRFNQELAESGELVETRGLGAPRHTRRLTARVGAPLVTDGPYAETQEVLAGYWIIECDSIERATEIAATLNECPGPAHVVERAYVDIRPIQEHAGEEF